MEQHIIRRDPTVRYDRSVQPGASPLWSESSQTFDVDLWRYVNMLLVRKYQLVLIFVVVMAAALLVIVNLTPRYTASATVLIAPDYARVVGIEAATTSLSTSEEAIASEVEVIRSSSLAQRAIAASGFEEFLVASTEPPLWERLLQKGLAVSLRANEALASAWDEPGEGANDGQEPETIWDGLLRRGLAVSLRANESLESALNRPADELDPRRVMEAFQRQLGVWQISSTNAIRIEFEATDPEIATTVANELARAYVDSQLEVKRESRSRAAELLGERLAALRERVAESDEAVEQFRREAGLVRSAGIELVAQQIAEQTSELVGARADLRNIEAQIREIDALRDAGQFERMYDLLGLDVIDGLRSDVIEGNRRLAREAEELGPRHPSMVELAADVAAMEARLASEVATAIGGLQSMQAVQANRVAELERTIAEFEQKLADLSGSSGELRKLEAEAEINRSMYATFLGQMQETQQAAFDSPDARVLSAAEVPIDPSFPNRKMLLALAMIAAFCFSSGSVLALEMRFGGALAEDELARSLGLPVLSAVPFVRKSRRNGDPIAGPDGALFEESFNRALNRIGGADGVPRSIMVTSAVDGEGKSLTVYGLARAAAGRGQRVLVIDCDLRRPAQRAYFGIDRSFSDLADCVQTPVSLRERFQDPSGLIDVIPAPARPGRENPQAVLRHPALRALVRAASSKYDLVLVDTPPVLAVSDALVVGGLVDATLMVVKWRRTPVRRARQAVAALGSTAAPVVGALLTQVAARLRGQDTDRYLREI